MSRRTLFRDEDSETPKKSLFGDEDSETPKKSLFAYEGSETPKKSLFAYEDDETPKKSLFAYEDDETPKKSLFADEDDETPKKSLFAYEDDETPKKSLFADEDDDDEPLENFDIMDVEYKEDYNQEIIPIYDTDLSIYDLSKANARIKSYVALHEYLLDVKNKNLLCSMDMEWLVRKERFSVSSENDNEAEAFKVYTNNELISAIGTKLLKDIPQHRMEIAYYNHFTDVVLSNRNPHFPLVSVSQECQLCEGIDLKLDNCLLVFSELADGSASSYFPVRMEKYKVPEILSMLCQTLIACLTLELNNLVHGDLHLGNILYHEEEEELKNRGKYLHYTYYDKHIYIKHQGKLWVLWDFGLSTPNGGLNPKHKEINTNTLKTDVSRIISLVNIRLKRLPRLESIEEFRSVFELLTMLTSLPEFRETIIISNDKQNLETVYPTYIIN